MDETYITRLKEISIIDVLNDIYGISANKKGDRYYCKIRPERTASCCIYPTNTYYDFGGGSGGDVISLVCDLEHCDKKSAMEKLSNYSGIVKEESFSSTKNKMLFDYEWKQLGLYPDMVSKNLNINILATPDEEPDTLADINLQAENRIQIDEFKERYSVTLNDFRANYPNEYHIFLKNKVMLPLLAQRDEYYLSLLDTYKLCLAVDSNHKFAVKYTSTENSLLQVATELNTKSSHLNKAIDDSSLLNFPHFNLNPSNDITKILSGEYKFKMSKITYYNWCILAKKHKQTLDKIRIPYDGYAKNYYSSGSNLGKIPHCSYYSKGECVIIFFSNQWEKMADLFGEKYLKQSQKIDITTQNQMKSDKFFMLK